MYYVERIVQLILYVNYQMYSISQQTQINFLRELDELLSKYKNISIYIDSEYSNGFSIDNKDFDNDIIKYYFTKKCKVCFAEVKELEDFCEECKKGCIICKDVSEAKCIYCNARLCKKYTLHRKEEALTNCLMNHFAQSATCYQKYKGFNNQNPYQWKWHDSVIKQIQEKNK